MRKCKKCGSLKDESEFIFCKGKPSFKHDKIKYRINICTDCRNKTRRDAKYKQKQKLVDLKGGKCEICGYSKCNMALDFHHKDPNEKDEPLSDSWNFEKAVRELEKCILVCSNCHREIHYLEKLNPPNIKGDIKEIT